jgi:hypothetical protein
MTEGIRLIGWDDLTIRPEAVMLLTSRALRLYVYLIMRAQDQGAAWPGIRRIQDDLNAVEGENWSEPTVKRYLAELIDNQFIYRERRFRQSSITYVFKTQEACKEFSIRITHDLTVVSPMIRQNTTTGSSEIKNVYSIYKSAFGFAPLFYDMAILQDIEDEYDIDFIEDAFIEAVKNNTRKLAYVDGILRKAIAEGRRPGERKGQQTDEVPAEEWRQVFR